MQLDCNGDQKRGALPLLGTDSGCIYSSVSCVCVTVCAGMGGLPAQRLSVLPGRSRLPSGMQTFFPLKKGNPRISWALSLLWQP